MNLDANLYLNLIRGGAARLAAHRQEINNLNVFPIPDGDTGDNMFMTIDATASIALNGGTQFPQTPCGLKPLSNFCDTKVTGPAGRLEAPGNPTRLGEVADAVSHAMLLGARGNSGVILSRIFAGLAKGFQGLQEADIAAFDAAMGCAVEEAYHAVSKPVEGTILTVLREGVDAARGSKSIEEFFDLWIAGMDLSLQHTPELLDVLKKAGVVDSGGAGLLCIAEGMRDALQGKETPGTSPRVTEGDGTSSSGPQSSSTGPQSSSSGPQSSSSGPQSSSSGLSRGSHPVDFSAFTEDSVLEFGYCTEFLLRLQRSKVDLETFDENVIKTWLESIGDSLVFFREGSIIKVHVHTMDPGAVLTRCREWGEFLTIKVENMTLQHHENKMDTKFKRARKALGIVTVASGKGLTDTFKQMGADVVISGGQTMNPAVERFLEAFDDASADTILVFPNNSNIILTAKQAAGLYKDSRIEVIPTTTLGEGYYALANLDTEMPVEEMVTSLTEAAASVVTAEVSQAIRDASGYKKGEYIGISGKDILCGAPTADEAVLGLVSQLEASAHDILVLFTGESVESADSLRAQIEKSCPLTEVIVLDGGQPVYDYILMLC
ncbi:MAG: DAK2 domain-containing protein [Bacteroidales bacterium]|nr:DAK2 domain-containing protein [Bacteroidales bacterium]